jgi:hypothetical protein
VSSKALVDYDQRIGIALSLRSRNFRTETFVGSRGDMTNGGYVLAAGA